MRRATVAALTACAVALSSPAAAMAVQVPHQDQASMQAEDTSDVAAEETDELPSNYKENEGETVLQSIKMTGNATYSYVIDVPAGYCNNDAFVYIEHANGDTEKLRRTIQTDSESTITVSVRVKGSALVASTLELWDTDSSTSGTYDDHDVPSEWNPFTLQDMYAAFSQGTADCGPVVETAACRAELVRSGESAISPVSTETPMLQAFQKLPGTTYHSHYARNYVTPEDGGFCVGSFEYQFKESVSESPSYDAPPAVGIKLYVGREYAGYVAEAYIDAGLKAISAGRLRPETSRLWTWVDESGSLTVPIGYLESTYKDEFGNDTVAAVRFDANRDEVADGSISYQGRISVNLKPQAHLESGNMLITNNVPVELDTGSGLKVSLFDCSALVSMGSTFAGKGGSGTGYEEPRPGGKQLGHFNLSFSHMYLDGSQKDGTVTFRCSVDKGFAGRKVKVYSADNWAPTVIDEIRTYTVDGDGIFYITMPLEGEQGGGDATGSINMARTNYEFIVNLEPSDALDISSAAVAEIPPQTWTGKAIEPKPAVTINGAALIEGTDYTLSYVDNVDEGTAKVIITGRGGYTGTVEIEFQIAKGGEPTGPDTPTGPDEPVDNPYQDLAEDKWYYGAVLKATELGIMNGYGDGTVFGAEDTLAREQAAAVLYNYLGEGAQAPAAPMPDVLNSWYTDAVNWAVANGVMDGYEGQNKFGIGDPLSREQFCAVIAKAVGADTSGADLSVLDGFPDASEISPWARPSVAWAVESGVISGVELPDGTRLLQPVRNLIRGEMAAMVVNAIEQGVLAK